MASEKTIDNSKLSKLADKAKKLLALNFYEENIEQFVTTHTSYAPSVSDRLYVIITYDPKELTKESSRFVQKYAKELNYIDMPLEEMEITLPEGYYYFTTDFPGEKSLESHLDRALSDHELKQGK